MLAWVARLRRKRCLCYEIDGHWCTAECPLHMPCYDCGVNAYGQNFLFRHWRE